MPRVCLDLGMRKLSALVIMMYFHAVFLASKPYLPEISEALFLPQRVVTIDRNWKTLLVMERETRDDDQAHPRASSAAEQHHPCPVHLLKCQAQLLPRKEGRVKPSSSRVRKGDDVDNNEDGVDPALLNKKQRALVVYKSLIATHATTQETDVLEASNGLPSPPMLRRVFLNQLEIVVTERNKQK